MKSKTLIFLASFMGSTCFAQEFTPVDYEFLTNAETNTNGWSAFNDTLSFIDVAANGYGQWAVNNKYGWFLLTNKLPNDKLQATKSTGCVARDTFPNDGIGVLPDVQIATNLRGSARFVWRNTVADTIGNYTFTVWGFNDQDFPTMNLVEKNIDIRLLDTISPVILPPFKYPPLNAGPTEFVANTRYGSKDEFQTCMDAKYLYIVYQTVDTANVNRVCLTVSDLNGNTITGYPKIMGVGIRPTVSCDVRQSPSSPTCDITYIDSVAANGKVIYTYFNAGAIDTQYSLVMKYRWDGAADTQIYSVPFHAKVLTGSVQSGAMTSKGIYVLWHAGDPGNSLQEDTSAHLVFHKIFNEKVADTIATYIDGWLNHCPTDCAWDVKDEPIRAVANPYDGDLGGLYNEFHAIYRLRETVSLSNRHFPPYINRLYIVRSNETDVLDTVNGPSPSHDISLSVNQSGLHVRWTSGTTHVYNRSKRYYDEPIEEHTLATNEVTVKDGRSHQGTHGATILSQREVGEETLPGRIMTLYSFGHCSSCLPNSLDLVIENDGSDLNIGDTNSSTTTFSGATLIVMQGALFWASNQSRTTPGGLSPAINVRQASTFDFRGSTTQDVADESSIFNGGLHFNLIGGYYDSLLPPPAPPFITNPATLIIRPMYNTFTQLLLPSFVPFTAENAVIDLTVFATQKPELRINGRTDIIYSRIIARAPNNANTFTAIKAFDYFRLSNCHVTNLPDTVGTAIQVEPDTNFYWVSNNIFSAASLRTFNPQITTTPHYFRISNNYFDNIPQFGIELIRNSFGASYSNLEILENKFHTSLGRPNTKYIYVEGFNNLYDEENGADLWINDNEFKSSTGNPVEAAIYLNGSTAGVLQNLITGSGFNYGIVATGGASILNPSTAFICKNVIQNCDTGIMTRNWRGYIKLTQVSECRIAHLSSEDDLGGIAFSKYFECSGPGIKVSHLSSNLELRGVFNEEENYAFYDTISNCNKDNVDTSGLIVLPYWGSIRLGINYDTSYHNYAHNNFIRELSTDNFIYTQDTNLGGLNIDSNYWGGYTPNQPDQFFPHTRFQRLYPVLPAMTAKPFSVACGSGSDLATGGGQSPQIYLSDTSCGVRLSRAESFEQSGKYQEGYQARKIYVEQCYYDDESWRSFHPMATNNSFRMPDTVGKNFEFREWLKKVLYYNTSDLYYCEDVRAMANSYVGLERADGTDANAVVAVLRFIIDSTDCDYIKSYLREGIQEIRKLQLQLWVDTVKDSLGTPMDTTLPSIDELGLSLIRKPAGEVTTTNGIANSVIDLRASPNPFSNEISIEYSLEDAVIVGIELLDILGREVYRTDRKLQPEGIHKETIITSNLTEGTYFVRLSTSTGETKSINLILER